MMVAEADWRILVVGAGGIGSLLTLHLSRAITFSQWSHGVVEITLMDGDCVEERNLPHQQFNPDDIGIPKVNALERYICNQSKYLQYIPYTNNFSKDTDISKYDLVVVAVDREEPRQLVHQKAECWLDLRASGDGFVMWSHLDDMEILNLFPKLPPEESASCQLEDAVEMGNIQFGFALAATHGAQWIIQWLRNSLPPSCRTYTIHMGELPLPEIDSSETDVIAGLRARTSEFLHREFEKSQEGIHEVLEVVKEKIHEILEVVEEVRE